MARWVGDWDGPLVRLGGGMAASAICAAIAVVFVTWWWSFFAFFGALGAFLGISVYLGERPDSRRIKRDLAREREDRRHGESLSR